VGIRGQPSLLASLSLHLFPCSSVLPSSLVPRLCSLRFLPFRVSLTLSSRSLFYLPLSSPRAYCRIMTLGKARRERIDVNFLRVTVRLMIEMMKCALLNVTYSLHFVSVELARIETGEKQDVEDKTCVYDLRETRSFRKLKRAS
jgi:hypothetical protein